MNDKIDFFLTRIKKELLSANKEHPLFNSYHEGYAVIKEEFEEMWDEIKKRNPDSELIKAECIQTAAMCLKMLISFDKE
jgi:hypothetical protein